MPRKRLVLHSLLRRGRNDGSWNAVGCRHHCSKKQAPVRLTRVRVVGGCFFVGEVVRLKVCDIDSKRMATRVTAGKGAKDRETLL